MILLSVDIVCQLLQYFSHCLTYQVIRCTAQTPLGKVTLYYRDTRWSTAARAGPYQSSSDARLTEDSTETAGLQPEIQGTAVARLWTESTSMCSPSHQSAHQLQESQSVFYSEPSFCETACLSTDSREASQREESIVFFRKTREMNSLRTFPRRQPRLPRAGAHCNGLWDVEKARTSPLHPQESRRLAPLFSEFFAGKSG